jgi:hypothetical protein
MEVVFHRAGPYGIVFAFHGAGAFHPVYIHYRAGGINFLGLFSLLSLLSSVPGFGQKKWEGGGGERS